MVGLRHLLKRVPVVAALYRAVRNQYQARRLRRQSPESVFTDIFATNYWGSDTSRSGQGSDDEQTRIIRERLPELFRTLGATSILDIPCGDFHWMQAVNLKGLHYTGADIVRPLVERNQQTYGSDERTFCHLNLITDALPRVDVIFTRDCLVHLSYQDAQKALANIARSGATWLVATTFPSRTKNSDIVTGDWRAINLQQAPFNFPAPAHLITEGCTEAGGAFADKALAVWRVSDLPLASRT